jgi:hypothetical protein
VPSPSVPIAEGTDETINGYGHTKKVSTDKDAAASVRTQDTEGESNMQGAELPPDLKTSAVAADDASTKRNSPTTPTIASRDKFLPPIPRDFTHPTPASPSAAKTPQTNGQRQVTTEDLFEMTKSSNMVVRFEIMIVKVCSSVYIEVLRYKLTSPPALQVPLIPLHGIQFRRIAGDGWQYQMLARRVLTELRL